MAHIHTEPGQHDHTVTGFIIRTDTTKPKAFLHMHKKLGRLLPIGGHVELDEDLWQAIAHELTEESGYSIDQLRILQPRERIKRLGRVKLHPYPLALNTHHFSDEHLHSDTAYGLVTDEDPAGSVGEGESSDIRWYTLDELLQLPETTLPANVREIYTFMFEVALPKWEAVATDAYA